MLIKVIANTTSISYAWYGVEIGKVFKVKREEDDVYWVRENSKYKPLNWILKRDCIITTKETK